MYPTHHFRQEYERARYADMLREARRLKVEDTLEAEVSASPGLLRRLAARRRRFLPLPRPAV
jgi:hypothetical protein